MKILSVNKYFFAKGGAENSFFSRNETLRRHGHSVVEFSMHHPKNYRSEYEAYFITEVNYDKRNLMDNIYAGGKLPYSFEARRKLEDLIRKEKPDIANLHNVYHQLSPSILHSFKKYNIPVTLTLHDYKLVCASYSMYANKSICEECKNGKFYKCFLKACVKDSRAKSLLNTCEMYLHHSLLKIYDLVDVFISPSIFLIDKFKEMGFKRDIFHLYNCVDVDTFEPNYEWSERTIVYFGRLSKEKGIETLVKAMRRLPNLILKIIGEGPLESSLKNQVKEQDISNVRFLGYKSGDELRKEILSSMFIVIPSEWYENNPRTVIEAFALGKPAIGARIGGIPELVQDYKTGLTFTMGDEKDLCSKIEYLINKPDEIISMGKEGRRFVEEELNYEKHYHEYMRLCEEAIRIHKTRH